MNDNNSPEAEEVRIINSARKRLGLTAGPQSRLEPVAALAAAVLGRNPPRNRPERIAALKALVERCPTRADGLRAIAVAKHAAMFIQIPKKRTKSSDEVLEYRASKEFLASYAWRRLRMKVLALRGAKCECCGATPADDAVIHVDHIKPRKFFPELALDETNLQVLCGVCNHGKGNWSEKDWRGSSPPRLVKR